MTDVKELPENIELPADMDARKWASAFRRMAIALGHSDMDEEWLVGWFANAIMMGYDTAHARAMGGTPPLPERQSEAMKLPIGKTCADCYHGKHCDALFGAVRRGFTSCDFYPSRFLARGETK